MINRFRFPDTLTLELAPALPRQRASKKYRQSENGMINPDDLAGAAALMEIGMVCVSDKMGCLLYSLSQH